VGFIRKLPHNLVASFKSTLKEVVDSDLILMVLDISSKYIEDHVKVIKNVLESIGAGKIPTLYVLNKVDIISEEKNIKLISDSYRDSIVISAKRHLMLSNLKQAIIKVMEKNYQTVDIQLPYSEGKTISQIKNTLVVLEEHYEEKIVKMKIRGSKHLLERALVFHFINNG
jgi:GTP-binding protein HflX